MPTWDYWHRMEYRRELRKGHCVLEYVEVFEDQGWTFCHRPERQQEWFVHYTRACAEDYLARVRARSGTWVVGVWRTGASASGDGRLLGSIRMRWTRR
ncbi:hypothetical protein [Amycolatopsis aidingensis]|uniref:hypothetical protein n=1 Tax=Amycolatopsis aidingensis TaxID=2842453 RepID=UPI001C0D9A7A|nr:hypothetical protein [Amycolatopsis aidingensis]